MAALPVIEAYRSGYGGVVMSNGPWTDEQVELVRRLCEAAPALAAWLADVLPVLERGAKGGPGGARCATLGPLCDRGREIEGRLHS